MPKKCLVQAVDTIQRQIAADYDRLHTWRRVAAKWGVSAGTAQRVAEGYEPTDPHIRQALGLAIYKPAPACPVCGEVHVTRT